ncbi:hypothetical protein [Acinetobacter haemolyticus]|uniref:hypothetical protein n=1 Tax=Acinetobacter haemolyticus TaxID=29430 RepID=UPI000E5728EF|nr:hypothetical protein [Acinetobacter haemolyticus]QDJ91849.1 hypothetical protein AhaeAN54_007025 [Acinetobacter haemolyticus]
MTTYTEMLEQPQIKKKIESQLGGHIMTVYRNAGYTPPVPMLHDDKFVYADPAPQKYANHLREGMKLFAEVLDEINLNGGGNA